MLPTDDIVKFPYAYKIPTTVIEPVSYTFAVESLHLLKEYPIYIDSDCNSELRSMALLYAMSQAKNIIINDIQQATASLPFSLKRLVRNKLGKMVFLDPGILDNEDIDPLMDSLRNERTNYTLTKNELVAIKSALRAYLRKLLNSKIDIM